MRKITNFERYPKRREYYLKNQEKVKRLFKNVVVNPHNLETHNSYSFWLAVKEISDDILCLDGDLLFSKEVLEGVIKHSSPSLI